MTRIRLFPYLAALLALVATSALHSQADLRATLFASADEALARARAADAELLAPGTFTRGLEEYASAESDFTRGRNMDRIRNVLATAARTFGEASDAAEIASVTLAAVVKTRADATNANAATFATELWTEASEQFTAAARRLCCSRRNASTG